MADQDYVSVCADCFEKVGKKAEAKALLQSRCLEPSSHEKSIEVRVRLTADDIIEADLRPTPKVHFKGEFVLCPREKCKGGQCTYPHCLKEKAAWNAEKFGFHLSGSATGKSSGMDSHYASIIIHIKNSFMESVAPFYLCMTGHPCIYITSF